MPTEHGEVLDRWNTINMIYPVTGMRVYHGAIEVIRTARGNVSQRPPTNHKITKLSKKSLSRLAFLVTATQVRFTSILTLTYSAIITSGQRVKKDLNKCLTWLRYQSPQVNYLWFLEFQRRGSPHLHVLLSIDVSAVMHEKLARYWSKLQGNSAAVYRVHRHTKAWEQIREPDGAARYALKYALKTRQKTVPSQYRDVGRFWGCSRSVRDGVQAEHEQAATEDDIRAIVSRVRPDFNAKCGKFLPKYIFLPNLS